MIDMNHNRSQQVIQCVAKALQQTTGRERKRTARAYMNVSMFTHMDETSHHRYIFVEQNFYRGSFICSDMYIQYVLEQLNY